MYCAVRFCSQQFNVCIMLYVFVVAGVFRLGDLGGA